MSTAAVIGLGILAWILVSILLALFVGRMIELRERQRPDRNPPVDLSATGRAGTGSQHSSGREARDEC